MKTIGLLALMLSFNAFTATITLPEYNFPIKDIADQKITKEELFSKMNRKLVRTTDSICSNRAHVWAYGLDIQNVDTAKVFLFFTPKTSYWDKASWWYHTAPVINENGKLIVMDAGFPGRVDKPLELKAWLKEFNKPDSVCKEIKNEDDHLVQLMFSGNAFPQTTQSGTYDCYYRVTPPGYWVPKHVAMNLTGKTASGKPVQMNRDEFNKGEVYAACRETSTTEFGWMFGSTKSRCKAFAYGRIQRLISE
jgi:hypothetical protein